MLVRLRDSILTLLVVVAIAAGVLLATGTLGPVCQGLKTGWDTLLTVPASQAAANPPAVSHPPVPGGAGPALALTQLNELPVKGKAPATGYARSQFGPAWADVDHNGCDTRNDILKRDLARPVFKAGSRCVITSGTLDPDPYTGKPIAWQRGAKTSAAVQIDHLVALKNAWLTGAQQWDAAKRLAFANDPANLLAVDGLANEAKSDADAASWLPPSKAYRCQYVTAQVKVKAKYGLWVTQAEHDAIARVLATCST